jgi:hypothetical protein
VDSGSDAAIAAFAAKEAEEGVHAKFADLERKRNFRPNDLAAGRDYVASYVSFVHYVEGLYQAANSHAAGHYAENDPSAPAHPE